jgi:hypothetical protein
MFGPQGKGVPPIVHDVLRSPGQPLHAATRVDMEGRFGHDFSGVRVHTDSGAAKSAAAVSAKAYTVGRTVVFGQGNYAPETGEGKRILAHELTHVVQQSRGGTPPPLDPNSSLEQEADAAAASVRGGSLVSVQGGSGIGVARDENGKFTIGEVRVEGRTPDQIANDIKRRTGIRAYEFAVALGEKPAPELWGRIEAALDTIDAINAEAALEEQRFDPSPTPQFELTGPHERNAEWDQRVATDAAERRARRKVENPNIYDVTEFDSQRIQKAFGEGGNIAAGAYGTAKVLGAEESTARKIGLGADVVFAVASVIAAKGSASRNIIGALPSVRPPQLNAPIQGSGVPGSGSRTPFTLPKTNFPFQRGTPVNDVYPNVLPELPSARVANDNVIPLNESQSGQWVQNGTDGWRFDPSLPPPPSFDPLAGGKADQPITPPRASAAFGPPKAPPAAPSGHAHPAADLGYTRPGYKPAPPPVTSKIGTTNITIPGTLGEIPFKESMKGEPGVYLYELVDTSGESKWGTALDPYVRFNGHVAKGFQGRMRVYAPHPRYQTLGLETRGARGQLSGGGGELNIRTETRAEVRQGADWAEILETPKDPGPVLITISR